MSGDVSMPRIPIEGHIHDQITLLKILAQFLWTIFDKEVDQFIRACAYFQLVNSCSHKSQQSLQKIVSDTPFGVASIDFWEPGDIT